MHSPTVSKEIFAERTAADHKRINGCNLREYAFLGNPAAVLKWLGWDRVAHFRHYRHSILVAVIARTSGRLDQNFRHAEPREKCSITVSPDGLFLRRFRGALFGLRLKACLIELAFHLKAICGYPISLDCRSMLLQRQDCSSNADNPCSDTREPVGSVLPRRKSGGQRLQVAHKAGANDAAACQADDRGDEAVSVVVLHVWHFPPWKKEVYPSWRGA